MRWSDIFISGAFALNGVLLIYHVHLIRMMKKIQLNIIHQRYIVAAARSWVDYKRVSEGYHLPDTCFKGLSEHVLAELEGAVKDYEDFIAKTMREDLN